MSTINIPRESTMQEISQALQTIAFTQAGQAHNITTWNYIAGIVRKGLAPKVFNIGDQLNIEWSDGETTYTVPYDVVHFEDIELKDGEVIPGMYLQWHYSTPFGVQFDAAEAFYYAETELPAGTYNVIVGVDWGTYCKKNEVYQFTLTKPVPAGGQITGFNGMPDNAPEKWKVYTYESATSTTPIETVTPVAGSDGTNLGTLTAAGDGKLNSIQRVAYGYNRWSQSAIRQYLNSAAAAGQWWKPQNKWDRPPAELASHAGFLAGYSDDFIAAIKAVKVRTALNTVTDAAEGTYEDTYDKIFLPSLEQEFITPQASGIEGDAWEYWKKAVERSTPTPWYKTFAEGGHPITYAINAKTSAQTVRLRSAYRGSAIHTWCVYASGNVGNTGYSATYSNRFAPACVIC